jgi:hypothetical protein
MIAENLLAIILLGRTDAMTETPTVSELLSLIRSMSREQRNTTRKLLIYLRSAPYDVYELWINFLDKVDEVNEVGQ